jgi:hypothetical protein
MMALMKATSITWNVWPTTSFSSNPNNLMSDGRYIFTTTLEGYINALKPSGKFNNCCISFKIPPELLPDLDEHHDKCLAWGANKLNGKRHEKALPKWDEDGLVKVSYNGPNSAPMFPWIDTDGNPIDPDTQIWKGTVVRLIVDVKPYVYGNKAGSSFKVRGAQVIKLVSSGGGSDAGELDEEDVAALFGTTDGFKANSPNYQPPQDSEYDEVSEEDIPF